MPSPETLDTLIDAMTSVLGIAVDPAWRDGVRVHLGISLGHARTVADFPLDDEAEPAPVFTP